MKMTIHIKFIDGSSLNIIRCEAYGMLEDGSAYYITKNGYNQFYNPRQVKFIGREYDLKEEY